MKLILLLEDFCIDCAKIFNDEDSNMKQIITYSLGADGCTPEHEATIQCLCLFVPNHQEAKEYGSVKVPQNKYLVVEVE
jgi:hypothetical protein